MPKSDPVHVTLTSSYTYRTTASTLRTLPEGWSGFVDADVAKKIEAEKAGAPTPAEDAPFEGKKTSRRKKAASTSSSTSTKAGGQGNDTSASGTGTDTVAGGAGTDTVAAGSGVDTIAGGNA